MKDFDKTVLWAVVFVAIFAGILAFVFVLGVAQGREEYQNELKIQLKENNRLLNENIALIETLKQVAK